MQHNKELIRISRIIVETIAKAYDGDIYEAEYNTITKFINGCKVEKPAVFYRDGFSVGWLEDKIKYESEIK